MLSTSEDAFVEVLNILERTAISTFSIWLLCFVGMLFVVLLSGAKKQFAKSTLLSLVAIGIANIMAGTLYFPPVLPFGQTGVFDQQPAVLGGAFGAGFTSGLVLDRFSSRLVSLLSRSACVTNDSPEVEGVHEARSTVVTAATNKDVELAATDPSENVNPIGLNAVTSSMMRSFIDGISVGSSFLGNGQSPPTTRVGVYNSLKTLIHQFPHHISQVSALRLSGYSQCGSMGRQALASLGFIAGASFGLLTSVSGSAINNYAFPFNTGHLFYMASAVMLKTLALDSQSTKMNVMLLVMLVSGGAGIVALQQAFTSKLNI